jgi:carboxypeptidase family protein
VASGFPSRALRARTRTCWLLGCFLLALATVQAQGPSTSRPGQVAAPKPATPPQSASGAAKNTDPNKGTGIIRGRIMLANGLPARRASIQLVSRGARATAAAEDGTYEFTDLPADSYRLSAGKPGYLVLEYGQTRAFERGRVITLGDGEKVEKIDVTLPSSGAISGRIADENGDPVEAVTVRLLQLQFMADRRQLVDVTAAGSRTTDDTGRYRIYGVPPGQYVVMATLTGRQTDLPRVDDTSLPGYAPTYYPGNPEVSQAQLVSVGLSQDVGGIDFALATAPTATLSGVATDSRNLPARVLLDRSRRSGGFGERPMRGVVGADGAFRFDNLPPGEYVLQSLGPGRGNESEPDFQTMFITMDGRNISGVSVQGVQGSTVSGRVTFEGLSAGAKPPAVQLAAWPTDFDRSPMLQADIARTRVGDDGRFALGSVQGPRRLRIFQGPSEWSLKAVRVNGFDVTDDVLSFGTRLESLADVEVVLTNHGPTISGTAADAQGHPAVDYSVVAFSTDPQRWYQRSRFMNFARPTNDGTFTVSGLAPGMYYVAAVDSLQGAEGWGEWQDPEFLRAISASATRVTLTEGQAPSLALRVASR